MAINTYLSITTLNVNAFKTTMKRHRVAKRIRKHDLYICYLQETHLRTKNTHRLKVKGRKMIFQANGEETITGVAVVSSESRL